MKTSSRITKLASCLLAGLFVAQAASAQQPRRAYVISEDAEQSDVQCGINYEGLRASASSILRQNGYTIVREDDPQKLYVYISANAAIVNFICAVDIKLQFYFISNVRAPWGQNYFAEVIICERSAMLTGPGHNMPSRTRERIAAYVEMCISQEERRRA